MQKEGREGEGITWFSEGFDNNNASVASLWKAW